MSKRMNQDEIGKRLTALAKKWKRKLYLNEWNIHIVIKSKDHPDGPETRATCGVDSPYLECTINIYPSFFKGSKKRQEHDIVHELCHIITDEITTIAYNLKNGVLHHGHHISDANERMTTRLGDLLYLGLQE